MPIDIDIMDMGFEHLDTNIVLSIEYPDSNMDEYEFQIDLNLYTNGKYLYHLHS